jgi:hypothetical protein
VQLHIPSQKEIGKYQFVITTNRGGNFSSAKPH